jgi:predicted outer membrane repeat protein
MFPERLATNRNLSRRLLVEPLEGRLVPATFYVTTTDDVVSTTDKVTSLREAVTAANNNPGPDVIMLKPGVYPITLPDGDFDVTDAVTIKGRGAGVTAVDGAGSTRLFHLIGTFDATFNGLTLRNGGGPVNGAAILADDASLTLTRCVVSGNSGLSGGGIDAEHGNVTLTRTTVVGNVVQTQGGGVRLGSGSLTMTNSTVDRNLSGADGAGIYSSGAVVLARSTVSNNDAFGTFAHGGGINAKSVMLTASAVTGNSAGFGGGISSTITVTAIDSTVSNNQARMHGGGIDAEGSVTLTRSTVAANFAGNSLGLGLDISGFGGGLFSTGNVSLVGSIVNSNFAQRNGGGVAADTATLVNVTVSGNVAGQAAGGLRANTASLVNVIVSDNSAGESGGGVAANTATLVNVTVSGNSARESGGGVATYTATLVNVTISGNSAGDSGGGVWAKTATLINDTITQNRAHTGGGLFHEITGIFTVQNSIVAQNMVDVAGTGPDVYGDFNTGGHNLIGIVDGSSGFVIIGSGNKGDLIGFAGDPLDPMLGPLQNNGGPTWTHALLRGSRAIDAGDNSAQDPITLAAISIDQRGRKRNRDGNGDGLASVDIGAFER